MSDTNFYRFPQNAIRGTTHFNRIKGITDDVIIEAHSAREANEIAESIGIYFDGIPPVDQWPYIGRKDCECCGNRWKRVTDREGSPFPCLYDEDITDLNRDNCEDAAIHYMDGRVVWR